MVKKILYLSIWEKNLTFLKILTIIVPALFVFLLELLRHIFFEESSPMIWGNLSLFITVIIASFFFSRFIFSIIERLHEHKIHHMHELATLNEVYQTVDEFRDLNTLLKRAMDKLIRITAADSGELFLIDEQSNELVHTLHSGFLKEIPKQETKLRDWLINRSILTKQQVIIENLKNFQSTSITFLADAGVQSLALVPLISKRDTIGVLCLFSLKPDFSELNDANLLLKIGNPVAVAIENARFYEKIQATAVLEERERISTELHDGLAQVLGYVITKSQATRQLLRKMNEANNYLAELESVAQEVYTDTREAILGLKTAVSGDKSMVSALREYAKRFNQMYGIKTEFIVGDNLIRPLSPRIELQAIRIVQEALSNIRKHAEATRITIRVTTEDDKVIIVVEDDGKGFDVDKMGKGDGIQFGLRNMKERTASIQGHFIIVSSPGNGTKVILTIPLISAQTAGEGGKKNENIDS